MVTPKEIDARLFRASALASTTSENGWLEAGLVDVRGGFAHATTSFAVAAVVAAQRRGEVVVWMQPRNGGLFPPDLDENGVDLEALVIVHVPVRDAARGRTASHELPEAAELLLRSGAIDLLVIDWRPEVPPRGAWLVRLQALARTHASRVMCLTDLRHPIETGPALVLRLEAERCRAAGADEPFTIETRVRRDKRHGTPPPPALRCIGPAGLP